MSHPCDLCGPCKSQQKQKVATEWCIQCDECLCPSCIDYHKALTITRDHTIVNKEERDIVLQFIESIDTRCTEHTDCEVEYYCHIHDVPCCRVCKVKTHGNCSGVRQISELNDTLLDLKSNVKGIERNIRFLDTMINNRDTQIKNLEKRADNFSIEMKRTKAEIMARLNSIESSLEAKFSSRYKAKYQKLENDKEQFNIRQKQLTQRRDQLLKIVELKTLSKVQRFLGDKKLMAQNEKEGNEIKSDAKSVTNVACTFDLSCWQLQIKDNIWFRSLPCQMKLDENSTELPVSVLELEEPKTTGLMASQKAEIPGLKWKTAQTREDGKTNIIGNRNKNIAEDKIGFTYKSHFRVFRKELWITDYCIKIIPNGNIVIGEVSQPTLFVYNDSGSKLGEVQLSFPPGQITTIDNSTVAVTVNKCIVVVDTIKFKVKNTLYLNERCYGIVFANGKFVVNCEISGFIMMSLAGEKLSKFPFTNAILHLCVCDKNMIASVEYDSELVHFFNIKTQWLTTSRCAGLFGAAGITSDTYGNIFAICNKSHKVYMRKAENDEWTPILDAENKIDNPVGIDYDSKTDTLYVSNNNGTSVYAYCRNKTTTAVM